MKNDFDFIKDQFSSDGVNAPAEINEQSVLRQLQGVEPIKEKKKSKKGLVIGITSAAVASVAVITAAAIAVTMILGNRPIQVGTPVTIAGTAKLTQFNSRDEVRSALDNTLKFNERLNGSRNGLEKYAIEEFAADDGAVSSNSSGSSSKSGGSGGAAHNDTYVQYTGVDEADTVKTDGKYIYHLSDAQEIRVYEAKGKDSAQVAAVRSDSMDSSYFEEFYLHGDRLIVLSQGYSYADVDYSLPNERTEVRLYDISDISHITLSHDFVQSGNYCSSRMIDGMLYVVTTQYATDRNTIPMICRDYGADKATFDEVPADSIYAVENPTESSFLTVGSFDTDKGECRDSKSVLGSAQQIYCNQDNLYVMATEYEPRVYNDLMTNAISRSWAAVPTADRTQLVKISLTDALEVKASGSVNGTVNN